MPLIGRLDSLGPPSGGGDKDTSAGFFDLSDRYETLSTAGDLLERLADVMDFAVVRGSVVVALRLDIHGKGLRSPFDAVDVFKILVVQTLYSLSDEADQLPIEDRLSF